MEISWLGVLWVLVVLVQEAGGQLILYTGQEDLLSNWKLEATTIQELEGLGLSLCGQRCHQQPGCHSYNYHRASGRCGLLGLTAEDSPQLLVPAEGWFYGDVSSIEQAVFHDCFCPGGFWCDMDPPGFLRCPLLVTYNVSVYTGNSGGVGSSSTNAYFTLFGDRAQGPESQFHPPGNFFEEDSVTSEVVETQYLGRLTMVKLEFRDSTDGWLVEKVVVEDRFTGQETTFPLNQWLDIGEGETSVYNISAAQ